jgi:hypothetical protein
MSYTIAVPSSSIQKVLTYGIPSITSVSGGVAVANGTVTITSSYPPLPPVNDPAYQQANVATGIATSSYNQANTATTLAQIVYDYANTIQGGAAVDNVARQIALSAQANTILIQGVNLTQNTWISTNNATQNTRISSIETINTNQNTSIFIIQGVDNTQNTRLNSIETININQNTAITTVNQFTQSAYNQANTGTVLAQSAFNYANTISGSGTSIDSFARTTANSATALAQAGFNKANTAITTSGGSITGTLTVTGNTLGIYAGNSTYDMYSATYSNGNGSYLRTYGYRWADGSNWTTASTKIQQRIDVTDQGYIEFNPPNGAYGMAFGSGATELVRITQGGNVGIGISSPAFRLDVRDASAATRVQITNTANAAPGAGIFLNVLSSGTQVSTATVAINNTGDLRFFTGTSSEAERMRITAAGLVGIGTASPNSQLQVVGRITGTQNLANSAGAGLSTHAIGSAQGQLAGVSFYPTFVGTGDNGPRRAADVWSGFNGGNWGTQYLAFGVGSAVNDAQDITPERMRITSAGNVGIKTTNPTVALEVNGNIKANSAFLNGSVGINTTNPQSALEVNGIMRANNAILNGIDIVPYVQSAYNQANTATTNASNASFPAGTALLFQQTAAPTGWTKVTTHNDKALRLVSGTVGTGGSVAFSAAFASQSVSGSVGATTLSESQIPGHSHSFTDYYFAEVGGSYSSGLAGSNQGNDFDNSAFGLSNATNNTGGGGSHTHGFSGTAINLAVNYVDVIIATKN